MATINKPGVYIQETLSPNAPVTQTTGESVAVFIGIADRGGNTTGAANSIVSTPILVSSWSDFVNEFSYGSTVSPFDTSALVASSTSQTYNNTVGTASSALKYAVKTFFDNGGSQAYIVRNVNKDSIAAVAKFRDNNQAVTQTGTWTINGTANTKKIAISSATNDFAAMEPGRVVTISGITSANYAFISATGKKWVVADVATDGKSFTIVYNGSTIAEATQTLGATPIKVNGGTASVSTLQINASDTGVWGNNLWVSITPSATENYFDLSVYYTTRVVSVASDLSANDRVETFSSLSMDSANTRYAPSIINNSSTWITVTDPNTSTATGYDRLPLFTTLWAVATTGANINQTDGSFVWNASATVSSIASVNYTAPAATSVTGSAATAVSLVRVGTTATTKSTLAGIAGAEGSTAADLGTVGSYTATDILPRLDTFTIPLVINYPDLSNSRFPLNAADAATTATNNQAAVNKLLGYAANRGDSFVILDASVNNTTASDVIGGVTGVSGLAAGYTTSPNFGALYYPFVSIADPASTTGAPKAVAPGGAVAAIYTSTDAARGVFKAPAGYYSIINTAVSVPALTATEFDLISTASKNLNVIRYIPGSGICVMGARTLSSSFADRYVPTRRTLNYLGSNLRSLTQFAVFEPNDQTLWSDITGIVSGYLDSFWRSGGLYGSTAAQAYYVKCDATINTPAVISAGELRIEIGVALQRPAEFVIIKLGQTDGGATVTTSI